jgi:hypothetical protein
MRHSGQGPLSRSCRWQARLKQIDEEVVVRYTEAWARGDKFPPVIAYRRNKRLIQVDGNRARDQGAAPVGAPADASVTSLHSPPATVDIQS